MRAGKVFQKHYSFAKITPYKTSCFETTDSALITIPGDFLLAGNPSRDYNTQIARLSNQFIFQNRGIFKDFGVTAEQVYDGSLVRINFRTASKIGAFPLMSPTSGKPDYGFIIKPRFGWSGIGIVLSQMGWRVVPTVLKVPLLPGSERKIPPWVLSSAVLLRIKALIDRIERRFQFSESDLLAPRGSIDWTRYTVKKLPYANFLSVPCRYTDLRDDQQLKSAIHFALRKHLHSLESQRKAGIIIVKLLDLCQKLLEKVKGAPPVIPSSMQIEKWYRSPMKTDIFKEGLNAIEWTVEDRGLAGLSDLQGLPWIMNMESFFEAWVENIAEAIARQTGGILLTGRKNETVKPIIWEPPYIGSQKYLQPDLIIEKDDETIIIDAKYKGHWEELNLDKWKNIDEEIRSRHREDILQILAYSTLATKRKISCCLIYPCRKATWTSLKARDRLAHKSSLSAGNRSINLILTAIPMESEINDCLNTVHLALS